MSNIVRRIYSRPIFVVTVLMIVSIIVSGWLYSKNKTLALKITELEEALKNSNDSLSRVQGEKDSLNNALTEAGNKNKSFADQINKINTDLETYERLRRVDPELLQKYSKIYFLNENYIPSELTPIDTKYLSNKEKTLQIQDRVWPFLRDLLASAQNNTGGLEIVSAYRSFGTQASLKSTYKITYGAGTANSFSADQGYSEHQLGTAVDFTTPKIGGGLSGFEKSDAFTWLNHEAYKYGFILSYPEGNGYYVFEPWHWRFVGLALAKKLHDEGKKFYDLDQREISAYQANMFNSTIIDN